MIDTIILLLSSSDYNISHPERFIPSADWALNKSRSNIGIVSKQNPTAKELRSGNYKPRLTLSNRLNIHGRQEIMLKLEFSLPKLFFGNNLNELRLKDFAPLMEKLAAILQIMGVVTTTQALAQAPVAAIHYSKNIILTDGSTPHFFISKIKEANIKLSLDTNQTHYRNDGHSFRWHCKSYQVVFYDKIRELEKEGLSRQKLSKRFGKRKKLEILRIEAQLNKRQKIKQLFQTLGIKSDLTLKNIFKPATSKKVLLYYLDEIERRRPVLLDYKASDKALLAALFVHNPDMKQKQIFQVYGLKKALEVVNLRELRNMFGKQAERNWYRLMEDVQKVKLPTLQSPFGVVREQLVKFKVIKHQFFNQG